MNVPPEGRDLGDGRINFPHRGPPPSNPPEGWYVDPEDDYTWRMEYKPCKHMVPLKMIKCDFSQRIRPHDFCELYKMKINAAVCATCPKREEPA